MRRVVKGIQSNKGSRQSKNQLLQDLKVFEGMRKDEEKGSNIRGSVVYWRMSVQWYVLLRDMFYFEDKDIQRIIKLISKKDIYEMPEEKKEAIEKLIASKGCDWKIFSIVSSRYDKKSAIATSVHNLATYNTDISINYSLLVFEYLIKRRGFDQYQLDMAVNEISYLDACGSDKIWKLREEIYEDTSFWISLDGESPEDAYGLTFSEFSKNTIGK